MISIGTLFGTLRLDDDFSARVKSAQSTLMGLGSDMDKLGKKTTDLGSNLLPISAAFGAAGIASSVFSANFEASMTRLNSLAGVAEGDIGRVKSTILELAPAAGIGPQKLADAMMIVSSTVSDTEVALNVLKIAAQGTTAGMGETADIARALTSVVNSYGAANITAAQAGDILAQTVKEGGAEAKELAPTLANVVPLAAQMGIGFAEVGANIATFTKLGVPASEAVNSLSSVMVALLKPTKQGEEALAALSAQVGGTAITYESLRKAVAEQGLAATMTDLTQKFGENKEGLTDVFGRIEALRNVMGTAGQQAETYASVLGKVTESTGSLSSMSDAMAGKSVQTWNQLTAKIQVLAIQFGDVLAPALNSVLGFFMPVLEGAGKLISLFTLVPAPIQGIVIAIGALVALAAPALLMAGSLLTAWGAVTTAFAAGTVGATALTAAIAILASPVTWIVAAVGALYLILVKLTGAWDLGITSFLDSIGVLDVIKIAWDTLSSTLNDVIAIVSVGLSAAWKVWSRVADTALGWVKKLADAVGRELIAELNDFKRALEVTIGFLTRFANKVSEIAISTVDAFKHMVEGVKNSHPAIRREFELLETRESEMKRTTDELMQKYQQLEGVLPDVSKQLEALKLKEQAERMATYGIQTKLTADGLVDLSGSGVIAGTGLGTAAGMTKEAKDATEKYTEKIKDLADQLTGRDAVQKAIDLANAIKGIGGVSTLSADGLKQVKEALEKADAAIGPLPPQLVKVGNELKAIEWERQAQLIRMASDEAKLAKGSYDHLHPSVDAIREATKQHNIEITALLASLPQLPRELLYVTPIMASIAEEQKNWKKGINDLLPLLPKLGSESKEAVDEIVNSSTTFGQKLGEIGDTISTVFANVNSTLGQTAQIAGGAFKVIGDKTKDLSDKIIASFSAGSAIIGQFAGASVLAQVAMGGLSGAAMGASIAASGALQLIGIAAGPATMGISIAVGAAVGALIGYFGAVKARAEQLKQVNMEATASIEDLKKKITELYGDASSLGKIGDIIGIDIVSEWGHQGTEGLKQFTAVMEAFMGRMKELTDELGEAGLGGVASQMLLDLIDHFETVKESAEVATEFIKGQLVAAAGGLSQLIGGLAESDKQKQLAVIEGQETQLKTIVALKEKELAQLKQIDTDEAENRRTILETELISDKERLAQKTAQYQEASKTIVGIFLQSQEQAIGLSDALWSTFGEKIARGESIKDALDSIMPAVETMRANLTAAGFEGGQAFNILGEMVDITSDKITGPLVAGLTGARNSLTGLHNSGLLNQKMFAAIMSTATQAYDAIVAGGGDADAALLMYQQTLQTAWKLEKDFGYAVDDSTQALIQKAKDAGLVGEKQLTDTEKQTAAIERMTDKLGGLLEFFQRLLPPVVVRLGDTIRTEFGEIEERFGRVKDRAEDTFDRIDRGARDAFDKFGAYASDTTFRIDQNINQRVQIPTKAFTDYLQTQGVASWQFYYGGADEASKGIKNSIQTNIQEPIAYADSTLRTTATEAWDVWGGKATDTSFRIDEGLRQHVSDPLEAFNTYLKSIGIDAWEFYREGTDEELRGVKMLIEENIDAPLVEINGMLEDPASWQEFLRTVRTTSTDASFSIGEFIGSLGGIPPALVGLTQSAQTNFNTIIGLVESTKGSVTSLYTEIGKVIDASEGIGTTATSFDVLKDSAAAAFEVLSERPFVPWPVSPFGPEEISGGEGWVPYPGGPHGPFIPEVVGGSGLMPLPGGPPVDWFMNEGITGGPIIPEDLDFLHAFNELDKKFKFVEKMMKLYPKQMAKWEKERQKLADEYFDLLEAQEAWVKMQPQVLFDMPADLGMPNQVLKQTNEVLGLVGDSFKTNMAASKGELVLLGESISDVIGSVDSETGLSYIEYRVQKIGDMFVITGVKATDTLLGIQQHVDSVTMSLDRMYVRLQTIHTQFELLTPVSTVATISLQDFGVKGANSLQGVADFAQTISNSIGDIPGNVDKAIAALDKLAEHVAEMPDMKHAEPVPYVEPQVYSPFVGAIAGSSPYGPSPAAIFEKKIEELRRDLRNVIPELVNNAAQHGNRTNRSV